MTTTSGSSSVFYKNELINGVHKSDQLLPILIVGGSDGSGTRAFVETLRELGAEIVSEDPDTFDVHASEIVQGWPGLIQRIFLPFGRMGFFSMKEEQSPKHDFNPEVSSSNDNLTQSSRSHLVANYEWPPQKIDSSGWPPQKIDSYQINYERDLRRVESDVERLLASWTMRHNHKITFQKQMEKRQSTASSSSNSMMKALASFQRGLSTHTKKMYPDSIANDIAFVIKAPVSMLALPVFTSSYSSFRQKKRLPPRPLKFLHVIRDGRDVALSNNQSPVIKFYNLTYPKLIQDHESARSKFSATVLQAKGQDGMYAKAMQLWNDWNLVVHRWATNHSIKNWTTGIQNEDNNLLVDYLLVRSEDLLIPGSKSRLDALTTMAKFVGSSLTPEELCCLSWQDTKDHGQSHSHNTTTRSQNKWRPMSKQIRPFRRRRVKVNVARRRLLANEFRNRYSNEKIHMNNNTNREQNDTTQNTHHHIISQRYGKWETVLKNNTKISEFFHQEGAEGLQVFGYNPYHRMNYEYQRYGSAIRDKDEDTQISNQTVEEISYNKSTIDNDGEDSDVGPAPGNCDVSIACSNKKLM